MPTYLKLWHSAVTWKIITQILSLFEAMADTNIALKSVYDCCLSDFVLDYLSLLPLTKLIDISVFIQLEQ